MYTPWHLVVYITDDDDRSPHLRDCSLLFCTSQVLPRIERVAESATPATEFHALTDGGDNFEAFAPVMGEAKLGRQA